MARDDDSNYTRITLRIPRDLHLQLEQQAMRTSKSLNAEIIARLRQACPAAGASHPELAAYSSEALLAEIGRRCP